MPASGHCLCAWHWIGSCATFRLREDTGNGRLKRAVISQVYVAVRIEVYDEQNRLTQIRAADETVLANYTYDALGRRITFEDAVAGVTTRYYYDGSSIIEERDGSDQVVRYHVNGAHFIDERVATYETGGPGRQAGFTYYLLNGNYSIAGTGNADGSVIQRLDYSATGDFAGGGAGPSSYHHDADLDIDIDLADFVSFQACFNQTTAECLTAHDFDTLNDSDGDVDLDDYARFFECSNGPFVTPDQACAQPTREGTPPPSGTFTLHGRPVDVLSDDHALMNFRARYYDPKHSRWLQRDPLPYNDGANLYEPFRANPLSRHDPSGEGLLTWLLVGDYDLSDAAFIKENTWRVVWTPTYGFFEGGTETLANMATEFGKIFIGESAAQQRLVNLVEAEYGIGQATAYESNIVVLRAVRQGLVDFFGASNVAVATSGEQLIFGEYGTVLVLDVGGYERVQAGVAGVGQFSGSVGGLGGGAISQTTQLQIAGWGLRTAARVAPANQTSQVLFLRGALAIGRTQYALESASAAQTLATRAFSTGEGTLTPSRLGGNIFSGFLAEERAQAMVILSGEQILETQFRRGAVTAGLDFASFTEGPGPVQLFLNEVKGTPGLVSPSRFTSLGLGKGGPRVLETNISQVERAIRAQVISSEMRAQLLQALDRAPIRLLGPGGFRVTGATEARIQLVTARDVVVVTFR